MKQPRYLLSYYYVAPVGPPGSGRTRDGFGNLTNVKVSIAGKPSTMTPEHIPGLVETCVASLADHGIFGATVVITNFIRYETDEEK